MPIWSYCFLGYRFVQLYTQKFGEVGYAEINYFETYLPLEDELNNKIFTKGIKIPPPFLRLKPLKYSFQGDCLLKRLS